MNDRAKRDRLARTPGHGEAVTPHSPMAWIVLSGAASIATFCSLGVCIFTGSRFDAPLAAFAAVAALLAAFAAWRGGRSFANSTQAKRRSSGPPDFCEILASAGPMVMAVGLDGRFTYVNPAVERLLGYRAAELMAMPSAGEILPLDQGDHLLAEMLKLRGGEAPAERPADALGAYMDCMRSLPPSRVPSFEAQLRRKNGDLFPVTLHVSALRDAAGEFAGLVGVIQDQTAVVRQEQALRESQERYRDLFEHSSEMIATLSPAGQFLYANPAWKRCFGLEDRALRKLNSFDELFGDDCRAEASALFRRALDGETIDRAPLLVHTRDGLAMDFELSLSKRQRAGNPLAVRCLARDVTQQKQRENRLALQLLANQIVDENSSPDTATRRLLEALCISHGWDVALKWLPDAQGERLELAQAWAAPGRHTETLIRTSVGMSFAPGVDLPGQVWKEGRSVWIDDLAAAPRSPRTQSAVDSEMLSGCAVPVRAGNKLLAVLEFYCRFHIREQNEVLASLETVASSLGQMLERHQERDRAEELSRRQEILLDSVADGICGLDEEGRITFANPAAARLLGTETPVLTGKPVHEMLHGSGGASLCSESCSLRHAVAKREPRAGEDRLLRADGSAFPAEFSFTPILEGGRFSGSVLSFRDISQRYALDSLKDEFVSTVSHELRTPLTSIRGALGLLSSGILGEMNDKANNLLRIALSNSDRLVRLINDILDLERIQSGRAPLSFRAVRLADVVRQAIDGMAPVADAAGVRLIHDATRVEIAGDADRLLQVLTNLLSNAIKFSPADSTVSVMMQRGEDGVIVSVIDQGRGIPADKLETVFGRFQQVDASDSRQKGGSGLGLAICRTIVMQHSGRIWAEQNPLRGSTFRVYLPYRPATAHPGAAQAVPATALALREDTMSSNGAAVVAPADSSDVLDTCAHGRDD